MATICCSPPEALGKAREQGEHPLKIGAFVRPGTFRIGTEPQILAHG
jgi:hypothetical protein